MMRSVESSRMTHVSSGVDTRPSSCFECRRMRLNSRRNAERVLPKTTVPRYVGRANASRTEPAPHPLARPCCARGLGAPCSFNASAMVRSASPAAKRW